MYPLLEEISLFKLWMLPTPLPPCCVPFLLFLLFMIMRINIYRNAKVTCGFLFCFLFINKKVFQIDKSTFLPYSHTHSEVSHCHL